MATVLVAHHSDDSPFVEKSLAPLLPILGLDRVSIEPAGLLSGSTRPAVDLVLLVISGSALEDRAVVRDVAAAVKPRHGTIAVVLDVSLIARLPEELALLSAVHLRSDGGMPLFEQLKALLQPLARRSTAKRRALGAVADAGADKPRSRDEWNAPAFSSLLKRSVDTYDLFGTAQLVESFAAHMDVANGYPADHASNDLKTLRSKRQFHNLCRYAGVLVEKGTTAPVVRRQYAQALIEQKKYDHALAVLQSVVKDCKPEDGEAIEARGLMGRLYKQQYVDADGGDERFLKQAVEEYQEAARNAPNNYWPAINLVSCTLRAYRDGFAWADPDDARQRALGIVKALDKLWTRQRPEAWDQASYTEAWVALNDFDRAEHALTNYLWNRGTDSFEVSSTYRQFVEVLQLDRDERGRVIIDRLWNAVDEHRSGGAFSDFADWPTAMLVRVSDEEWQPRGIPGLIEKGRIGTVVSIEGSKATVQALYRDSMVVTVAPGQSAEEVKECKRTVPFVGVAKSYTRGTETYSESGSHALIAVIDNGIDVLHEAFLDGNKRSRIVAIWDQRDPGGPPPSQAGFHSSLSDGRLYTQKEITEMLPNGPIPGRLRDRNFDANDINVGHGTHVASIAAGRETINFGGGVAPEAKLAVVIPTTDEPLGYSKALIGALQFIDELADKEGLPVVVNVSLGTNGGAHDGSSPLEVAFGEFSKGGAKPGRVVVKSAGNEGESECHVETSIGQGNNGKIRWTRFPDSPLSVDEIEVWWPFANEYKFTLESPDGSTSSIVYLGEKKFDDLLQDTAVRMVLSEAVRDNAMNRLKIRIGDRLMIVPDGTWTLKIHAPVIGNAAIPIHAWIERREGKQSRFLQASPRMTLSVPATADHVIAVGSIALGPTDEDPVEVDASSSQGPTRHNHDKPDLSAPGVKIMAARSGSTVDAVEMSGTSMAAPHVTGTVALALSRAHRAGIDAPSANEVRIRLTHRAKGYTGQPDPITGFGTLNVPAFLNAFSLEPPDED